MALTILDPTVAAAVAAATSQEAQRAALFAPFGSNDVTVRIVNGGTVRSVETAGPWLFDSNTPRGSTIGQPKAPRSVLTTGAPTAVIFRTSGGVDIFSLSAAVSPAAADIVFAAGPGGVVATARTNLADAVLGPVTITANPALPVTVAPATALTLSLSASSGTNGVPITITVTPNGPIPSGGLSVSLAASNGGVLGTTSLSFTSGSAAAQTTTLTRASTGSSTVTMTNTGGLTNTGSGATFASAPAASPPVWSGSTPATLGPFLQSSGGTAALAAYVSDPNGDTITYSRTGGTAPVGVVVDPVTGVLTVPAGTTLGSYTVTIDATDTGANVTSLALTGGGVGVPWTFGQTFVQGDVPDYLDATDASGTMSAFQADVRNRWSDGSVKFAVLSGIGGGSLTLKRKTAAPSYTPVALGTVQASVTIFNVTDYLGATTLAGPVTVTMPNTSTPATFGADPATHAAGLVRSIPGPVMTEYHYYAPVPGEKHLAVWWYVRAYSNGEREIETQIECTPWVTVAGGGRRDYTVSVSIGGSSRMSPAVVQHYARTSWSRVDWAGTAPQVKPRHDIAYLRRFAFPYNNLATPNKDALNYGSSTLTLAANTFSEAMAPPINNPAAQLQWPNEIGTAGTGGMLRTNIEAAYAAGADTYWSAEAHARAAGRYPIHVRDPITGRPWNVASNPTVRYGASFTGGYWGQFTSTSAGWKATHAPPIGSGAYLLSGRYSFMERMQQQANAQALDLWVLPDSSRYGYAFGGPYGDTSITPSVRYGAWLQWGYMNQSAWSPAILGGAAPATADAELRTALAPYVERFIIDMRDAFVTGTIEGGIYKNSLGCVSWSPEYLGNYSTSENTWGDNFQQNYICFVLDAALDLDLPVSGSAKSAHAQLHAFAMSRVVALAGTWSGSGWNYRYYSQHLPAGPRDGDGVLRYPPARWFTNYSQVWSALLVARGQGLINLDDANGGVLADYQGTPTGHVLIPEYPRSAITLTDNTLQQYSVLALAVDRGIAGAAAAWTRLQSSPTMQAPATLANFKDYPATYFTPRTL